MPELHWDGKNEAVRAAKNIPARLLEFDSDSSVGGDDNLIVQGDNLDALNSLLPFYRGRVKCVYIDPPYNTHSAFEHYDDNFEHAEWLSMMYPRLELLRDFLSDDGAIFISINFRDEYHHLRCICDEIFGVKNYVGTLTWESLTQPTNSGRAKFGLQIKTEPILCYRNNAAENIFELTPAQNTKKYPHQGKFGACRFEIIEKSDAGTFSRPTMKFKILGQYPREGKRWQIGEETARQLEAAGRVEIVDGIVKKAIYPEDEADKIIYKPFWSHLRAEDVGTAQSGKELLNSIMGEAIGFDTVKPPALIEELIRHLGKNSIVLDAFAGSGTTAHAVINLNASDGGARKFILIEEKDYCKTITAERVRRVGGSFKFFRVGAKLFEETGALNPAVTARELAAVIWFKFTGRAYPSGETLPLIGIHEGAAYYLADEPLTRKFLATLPAYDGQKIIFAPASRLSADFLSANKIIFKQLPSEIKA
ncbi:MAG: site-specific DNA-methyltransferase [Selenomonadaceae bacterium]|nr:site-specific DNA-methyltransferase [Selenomonadaceae bacterium]